MFLANLISTFYLLTAPQVANPTTDVLRQHHLETAEGRMQFLNQELIPFMAEADTLNQEIIGLSQNISQLASQPEITEEKQAEIYALTEKLNQKMSQMEKILPALGIALQVDSDLQQVEALLNKKEPLTSEEQAIIDRLKQLCGYIEVQKNFHS